MPLDDTVRFDSLEAQNVSDPLEIDFTDPTQTHEFFAEYGRLTLQHVERGLAPDKGLSELIAAVTEAVIANEIVPEDGTEILRDTIL